MQNAIQKLTGGNPAPFSPPAGVTQQVICAISGTTPSQWCPQQRSELFAIDQPPLPASQDLWQKASIDTWTGLLASPACSDFVEDKLVLNVSDPFARKWIRQNPQGQAWADQMGFQSPGAASRPTRECKSDDPHPSLEFAYPRDRDTISASPLDIYIQADAQGGFDFWQLDYALGESPVEWQPLARGRNGFRPAGGGLFLGSDRYPLFGGDLAIVYERAGKRLRRAPDPHLLAGAHAHPDRHPHAHRHPHAASDRDAHPHRHARSLRSPPRPARPPFSRRCRRSSSRSRFHELNLSRNPNMGILANSALQLLQALETELFQQSR